MHKRPHQTDGTSQLGANKRLVRPVPNVCDEAVVAEVSGVFNGVVGERKESGLPRCEAHLDRVVERVERLASVSLQRQPELAVVAFLC